MHISPAIVSAARSNGRDDVARRSALPGERMTRVDDVVDLLAESTSPAAQPGARMLLQQMAAGAWDVIRGIHRSPDDATPHVSVEVAGVRYHLRLDARQHVFDVTRRINEQTVRPSGHPPWVAPGA